MNEGLPGCAGTDLCVPPFSGPATPSSHIPRGCVYLYLRRRRHSPTKTHWEPGTAVTGVRNGVGRALETGVGAERIPRVAIFPLAPVEMVPIRVRPQPTESQHEVGVTPRLV